MSNLFADLNKIGSVTSTGYQRFQITRKTLQDLIAAIEKSPKATVDILELCLQVRGKDKRFKE